MSNLAATTFLMTTKGVTFTAEDQRTEEEYEAVGFSSAIEGEENPTIHEFQMNAEAWRDMGEPDTITVLVQPGDTLNA